MTIAYAVPTEYEFGIVHGGATAVAAGTFVSLTTFNMNPASLLDWAFKHEEALIPEAHGAIDLSDGFIAPSAIEFYGEMAGDDPDDTWNGLAARFSNFISASRTHQYIRFGLYDGSVKQLFRRYGKVLNMGVSVARSTRYTAAIGFTGAFRVLDPLLYYNLEYQQAIVVVSGTGGNVNTADNGIARSKRCVITITRTGSGVTTNPTVTNVSGQSFTITDTLPSVGDSWTIDMMNGTVIKSTSGVLTNARSKMTGQFWGVRHGTDTITLTSTVSSNFACTINWLERRM
jgi:hypothetical protein